MAGRDDFDLSPDEIYLDGAYCSPHPRAARQAVAEAYGLKAEPSRITAREFFGFPDGVRARLGRVLGVPEDEVGITTSTSFGAMLLAQSLPWPSGARVLLGPDEFPSNVYPWQALSDRGLAVEFVGRRGHPLEVGELERALASRPGVQLLAVAAVHYLTGDLHPLAEFAQLLHERGGWLVVDATQAAGCVALDWRALGVDALVTSGYKWLLGPYGCGAMWVRRELLARLANVNRNWWATENARHFERVLDYSGFPVHARMLDSGETASFLNLAAFGAGLDLLLATGVPAIEAHHRALQDLLVAELQSTPLRLLTRFGAAHRSPILYFELAGGADPEPLRTELARSCVRVSMRSGRLRVSPGIWSAEADVRAFAAAARRAMG